MKIQAFNIEGKKTVQVDLSVKIFSVITSLTSLRSISSWFLVDLDHPLGP